MRLHWNFRRICLTTLLAALFMTLFYFIKVYVPQHKFVETENRVNLHVLLDGLGSIPNKSHFYISKEKYESNLHPKYYRDFLTDNSFQIGTYYIAAEIARRYHARYIIDIGCGNGAKLARLSNEFLLIGVDYGQNLQQAKESFPMITFIEADLDLSGNGFDLDQEVVMQSVVISADVIEHLRDPLKNYIRIIRNLAEHALAIVLSSPDRELMAAVYKGTFLRNRVGPPSNPAHVREWVGQEMEYLLYTEGMYPVYSGQICGKLGACSNGYYPTDSSLTNHIHVIGNTKIRKKWLANPRHETKVTAFVIMHKDTNLRLLQYNINYLHQQHIQIYVLFLGPQKLSVHVPMFHVAEWSHIPSLIKKLVSKDHFTKGDWFVVMDAHEVITFPQSSVLNLTLKESLVRIGREPHGFNAVALSTFFMQDKDGKSHSRLYPFKVFATQAWNTGAGQNEKLWPAMDTYKHRIRIWRKGDYPPEFKLLPTSQGTYIVSDVCYIGRHIYPFHAQSLRFHPSHTAPYSRLGEELRRMYLMDTALGYLPRDRAKMATSHYLY